MASPRIMPKPGRLRARSQKAAAAGNTAAMNGLGDLYFNGNGVPEDYAEARKWYERALAAGDISRSAW